MISKQLPQPRIVVSTTLILILLCVAQFLDAMDISSVGVILPAIQHEFSMSAEALQWIVSSYVLGFGGFLLLGGRIADLFGRRRVFIIAMTIFGLASLVGAFADTEEMIIVTRVIKGVAAGFTAPAALSLLLATYNDPVKRTKALGAYSTAGAVGFTIGIVVGGLLGLLNWRFVFLLPFVIALLVVVAAFLILPPDEPTKRKKRFDLVGSILVTSGLILAVYGVTQAATAGWLALETFLPIVFGLLLLATFIYHQGRVRTPLMPLQIFRSSGLSYASILAFFVQGNYTAFQFIAVLYLQSVLGWSAIESAGAFVFSAVIVGLMAPRFAKIILKIGTIPVIAFGAGLHVIAFAWFMLLDSVPPLLLIAVLQIFIGLGFAASFPALNIKALSATKEDEHGLASGVILSAFSIGSGVIVALAASVFAAANSQGLESYRSALTLITTLSLGTFVISLFGWHRHKKIKANAEK